MDLSIKKDMMAALAFMPVEDIIKSFKQLADSMPEETQPITDYFEDTYIAMLSSWCVVLPYCHASWCVVLPVLPC